VIVVTHLVEDVGAACGEVALLDAGRIVFQGTPEELTARGEGAGAAGDAPLERGYSAVFAVTRCRSTPRGCYARKYAGTRCHGSCR
jgi:ABC-type multidrug transport system ATPase subunit